MTLMLTFLSILTISFNLTGFLIYFLSIFYRPSNFLGKKALLIPLNAFLFILFGSLTSLVSDICRLNWVGLGIQLLVSILYLYIYNTHKNSYRTKLEHENR
jgi:hypothetical protein